MRMVHSLEWKYTAEWKLEVVELKLEAVGWKFKVGSGSAFWAMVVLSKSNKYTSKG